MLYFRSPELSDKIYVSKINRWVTPIFGAYILLSNCVVRVKSVFAKSYRIASTKPSLLVYLLNPLTFTFYIATQICDTINKLTQKMSSSAFTFSIREKTPFYRGIKLLTDGAEQKNWDKVLGDFWAPSLLCLLLLIMISTVVCSVDILCIIITA